MSDFKELANDFLKASADFKKAFSISETKSNILKISFLQNLSDGIEKITSLKSEISEISLNQLMFAMLIGIEIPDFIIAKIMINGLIKVFEEAPSHNYTIKELCSISKLEDWKIRRIINSDKLKAVSKFKEGANPGRSGYSISKENIIEFLREYGQEIFSSDDIIKIYYDQISQIKPNIESFIDNFLEQVNPIIELGKLEQELAEETKDKKEELTIRILLQKLEIEKNTVAEIQKKFRDNNNKFISRILKTPKQTAENSNEQLPETQ